MRDRTYIGTGRDSSVAADLLIIYVLVIAVVLVIVVVGVVVAIVNVVVAVVVVVVVVVGVVVATKKCSMYWPVDGEEKFGEISVRLLTTHVFAEYTIRNLRLSKNGEPFRYLTQFHFTAWPDKSVPESPWGLVDLQQRVMAVPGSGPIVVHCRSVLNREENLFI
ncbi:receptor-type tyrosine-protein phosphatase U [Elysia marginata]|uniref:protein-tyrosine-phosphatase n=1 Tax=Elysia marginata TaxID=1093978 RepID=A0AAV4GVE7_9GAST|nr:receptor-type tyrosine-protein phosphatase U [Elysia marginata]